MKRKTIAITLTCLLILLSLAGLSPSASNGDGTSFSFDCPTEGEEKMAYQAKNRWSLTGPSPPVLHLVVPSIVAPADNGYIILTNKADLWKHYIVLTKIDDGRNRVWRKTFPGLGWDMAPTDDGFIIGGTSSRVSQHHTPGQVWKISKAGNIVWTTSIAEGSVLSVASTGTGCCITATDGYISYLIKLDSYGKREWTHDYSAVGEFNNIEDVEATRNGGYIITGDVFAGGDSTILLMKTSHCGDIEWIHYIPGLRGNQVKQTRDGGYIIAATTDNIEICLIKTDTYGGVEWKREYTDSGLNYGEDVEEISDGYIMLGTENGNIAVIKTDTNGVVEWQKTFCGAVSNEPTYEDAWDVDLSGEGYIIIGTQNIIEMSLFVPPLISKMGITAAWTIKLDGQGETEWENKWLHEYFLLVFMLT